MIHLTASTAILIATQPADFRKGIDGLVALCQQGLQQNPRSGTLYVFINRAATMIRILAYDRQGCGYWLMTKRLSRVAWALPGLAVASRRWVLYKPINCGNY